MSGGRARCAAGSRRGGRGRRGHGRPPPLLLAAAAALLVSAPAAPAADSAPAAASPSASAPTPTAVVPAAGPAGQQDTRGAARDSQEVREGLEDRQREFEERRRSHLETTWGRPVTRCDEVVGRFCLWHGEGGGWDPPEEPAAVERARARLIAGLDSAARRIPGDPWVAGQRVRYLLEGGRTGEALEAARRCRSSDWWCRALAGLAHHRAGRYPEAERSFGGALEAMGRERACRWRNLTDLLEGELADRFEDRPCAEWARMEDRVWWLADPFYLVPGNGRRSEHFARWVLDRTQRDAETPSGVRWGEDLQELLARYGWPTGWERDVSTDETGASVISHYPSPARRWMPPEARHVDSPGAVGRDEWPLDPRSPRSEYAPRYVRAFGELGARVSRFRRGDSALVVAAYRLAPEAVEGAGRDADTVSVRGWVRAGLFLAPGPDAPAAAATTRTQGREGVLAARAGSGGRLLSLETLAPVDSVSARLRHGVRLPAAPEEGVALSDLMLVEADGDTLPAALEEVMTDARAGSGYPPGGRLGLYWEVYGPAGSVERIRTSVSLVRGDGGFLRSVGELLGLGGGGEEAVRMEWEDRVPPGRQVHPRSLVIRLPEDLPEAEYTLVVEAAPAGGDTAAASRRVRVREGG